MLFPLEKEYKYRFETELDIFDIAGGIPSDSNTIRKWILTGGISGASVEYLRDLVTTTILERSGKVPDLEDPELLADAVEEIQALSGNGFKRTPDGELYIEGRQVKAMIKEVGNIMVGSKAVKRKWGETNKGLKAFLAEHVVIPEKVIGLGVNEETGVAEGFVHTYKIDAIKREEIVENPKISFKVLADFDFGNSFWTKFWTRAQTNGIGASRSQGRGTFEVTRWEQM